jgi:hypothetical protein
MAFREGLLGLSVLILAFPRPCAAATPTNPVSPDRFTERLNKQLTHLSDRIGQLNQNGLISGEELGALMSKQQALKDAYAAAKADGKITKDERAALEAQRKDLAGASYEGSHGQDDFSTMSARMQSRIDRGKAQGWLTAA